MRVVDIRNGAGDADALFLGEAPMSTPKATDAVVKIKAFGLNRMDTLQREGKYPVPPQASKVLGVEFSGTVHELGGQAESDFKVGDEVFGLAYGGAYAEYIAVSTHMLIHKPRELSWEEAAGVPETWITATQALFLIGGFAAGKSVLWHAGASGVSIAGAQLARAEGAAAVYATAGSDEKTAFCERELGVTKAFNYRTQDWSAEVLKATGGKGVDVIVDFIGASYFQGNLNAAATDGRIVCLGLMGGVELPAGTNIAAFIGKKLRFEGSSLRSRDEAYQGKLRDTLVEHALPKFKDGSFKIYVDTVMPWEKIVDAHKLMESNKTKGKIICTIG